MEGNTQDSIRLHRVVRATGKDDWLTQSGAGGGSANGANPIPIIVPCHRVIASDGSLGGYALGLKMKRFLLELERD
jgi:alkylated DNA nucleotide flippase Atl1